MTERLDESKQSGEAFVWHPDHVGKSFASVRRELEDDIERDQRAYDLALEQAENEEHDAFNTVREVEKRWSEYDFGWFDLPPKVLADRIMAFERAREERQELISWQDWKAEADAVPIVSAVGSQEKQDWRENLTDQQRRRLASGLSVLIILGIIAVCALLYTIVT